MEDTNKAVIEMHMNEDDKRFNAQFNVNADLYRRIDGINLKLWLIMAGIFAMFFEPLISKMVGI